MVVMLLNELEPLIISMETKIVTKLMIALSSDLNLNKISVSKSGRNTNNSSNDFKKLNK